MHISHFVRYTNHNKYEKIWLRHTADASRIDGQDEWLDNQAMMGGRGREGVRECDQREMFSHLLMPI